MRTNTRGEAFPVRFRRETRDVVSTSQAVLGRLRSTVTSAMADSTPPIVSVDWLKERLGDPGVKVLDASWFLPSMGVPRLPILPHQTRSCTPGAEIPNVYSYITMRNVLTIVPQDRGAAMSKGSRLELTNGCAPLREQTRPAANENTPQRACAVLENPTVCCTCPVNHDVLLLDHF